jgi:hypothetical protein
MTTPHQKAYQEEVNQDDKFNVTDVNVDEVPVDVRDEYNPALIDETYMQASRSTRFWRGTLFQMILFGT